MPELGSFTDSRKSSKRNIEDSIWGQLPDSGSNPLTTGTLLGGAGISTFSGTTTISNLAGGVIRSIHGDGIGSGQMIIDNAGEITGLTHGISSIGLSRVTNYATGVISCTAEDGAAVYLNMGREIVNFGTITSTSVPRFNHSEYASVVA